jgi:sugar O-acyltransferase (sialic acid O-acetyltransferase NeuD family)
LENIAIYGAGGFGKETKFLLEAINRESLRYVFQGYLDDQPCAGVQLAGEAAFQSVVIAIASPLFRKKARNRCGSQYAYPNLVDPHVFIDQSVVMSIGSIICAGVKITIDVQLGDFVIVNLNATIGHDVEIGSFSSIMPGVNISGNVTIGDGVFIGAGATVLQGLKIGDGAVIGAGAVVTKDVPPGVVAKGVPARWG